MQESIFPQFPKVWQVLWFVKRVQIYIPFKYPAGDYCVNYCRVKTVIKFDNIPSNELDRNFDTISHYHTQFAKSSHCHTVTLLIL